MDVTCMHTPQSVLARGLHALLPPIEVVRGSICNSNPDNPREWEVRAPRRCTLLKWRERPCARTGSSAKVDKTNFFSA